MMGQSRVALVAMCPGGGRGVCSELRERLGRLGVARGPQLRGHGCAGLLTAGGGFGGAGSARAGGFGSSSCSGSGSGSSASSEVRAARAVLSLWTSLGQFVEVFALLLKCVAVLLARSLVQWLGF